MAEFNELQKRLKKAYENVIDDEIVIEPLTIEQMEENAHGDTLLNFLVYEAADAGDLEELVGMVRSAASQLQAVADELDRELDR